MRCSSPNLHQGRRSADQNTVGSENSNRSKISKVDWNDWVIRPSQNRTETLEAWSRVCKGRFCWNVLHTSRSSGLNVVLTLEEGSDPRPLNGCRSDSSWGSNSMYSEGPVLRVHVKDGPQTSCLIPGGDKETNSNGKAKIFHRVFPPRPLPNPQPTSLDISPLR